MPYELYQPRASGGGGGGGAPTDATYITQTPNASLSGEQALSALSTGLLKVTTGTGVLSAATDGTDYLSGTTYKPRIGNAAVTGVLTGLVVSINADPTKFDVSAGTVLIVDNYTDPANPTFQAVSYAGATGITPTDANALINLHINSSGTLGQTVGSVTSENRRDLALIGGIITSSGTVTDVSNGKVLAFDTAGAAYDLMFALGNINVSGNNYSANGVNLKIDRSAGVTFFFGGTGNDKDPNNLATSQALQDSFIPIYRDGSGGTVFQSATTDINVVNYDNGTGTLATVGGGNFVLRWIIFAPSIGQTFVAYGQDQYNTLDQAISGMFSEAPVINTDDFSLEGMQIRGCLAVQKNATSLSNAADAAFRNGGIFGLINGAGASSTGIQNLQSVYDASVSPEIITDSTRGAFSVQRGSAADTDNIYEGLNGAGSTTFSVDGNGLLTATNAALGTGSLTLTGSIGATGARATKVWATDIESTNMPTVGGTSLSSTFSPIAGSASITTLGTVTTGTLSTGAVIGGVTMTLGSDATGDIYYRNAGGVLTRLGVGSDGEVLTLASGLPSWAAAGGGGLTWEATVNGATGTGLALAMDNSYAASGIGQSITIGDTQTQNLKAVSIDMGTSNRAHSVFYITNAVGYIINASLPAINASNLAQKIFVDGTNFNTNSAADSVLGKFVVSQNAGAGYNTGWQIDNSSTEVSLSAISGMGFGILQRGAGGTAFTVYGNNNVNSSSAGLVNYTLSNTQSGASVVQKIDTGTSAQGHTGLLINAFNASTSARGIKIDGSTTGTGIGIEVVGMISGAMKVTAPNTSSSGDMFTIAGGNQWAGTMFNITSAKTRNFINFVDTAVEQGGSATPFVSITNTASISSSTLLKIRDTYNFFISRTGTFTSGTMADDFNHAYIKRTSVQNGAGGTFTAAGSVLKLENVSTQTAGTLTDSVAVLSLVQDNDSIGGHILFNAYSGTPTANGTLWYDGTNLKYIDGTGTTKTVTVT